MQIEIPLLYLCMDNIKFKEKIIRVSLISGQMWFSSQDVFNTIGLTWKGADCLLGRGISSEKICKTSIKTNGGNQIMIMINNIAVKQLLLKTRFLTENESILMLQAIGIDCNFSKINTQESVFRNTIKSICDSFYLSCYFQWPVLNYKVDIFIPYLGFIEYDEHHHKRNKKSDSERLNKIKDYTKTDIYRCNQGDEYVFYTRLIKKLMEIGIDKKELE